MNAIKAIGRSPYHMATQYISGKRIKGTGIGYTVMITRNDDGSYDVDVMHNGELFGEFPTTKFTEGNDFERLAAAQLYAMECSLAVQPDAWYPAMPSQKEE